MEIESLHKLFLECSSVSIDTRKIDENGLFVALKGDRFDANTFAAEALLKGARYVIIDNANFYIDQRTILVEDSLSCLQELAKFHRNFLNLPIISLTGSNGKTTTKELIQVVLKKKYQVKATVGNFNNHIGVPLTLLSFNRDTEIGIVEMGANHQREIAFLCELAKPNYGYITNFGKAHLQGFGGFEGVIKGKSEMYDYLRSSGKMAFVNFDDSLQVQKSADINRFAFGLNCYDCDLNFSEISAEPFVQIKLEGHNVASQLIGDYNANNVMAAIAIGRYFGVTDANIIDAIADYSPDNNRSQLMAKGSNEIILDAYNANPSSMMAALKVFTELDRRNKLAILGDMFELGEESAVEHKSIIESVLKAENIRFLFVGKQFSEVKIEANHIKYFDTFELLKQFLVDNKLSDTAILVKGSRGMALERVVDLI